MKKNHTCRVCGLYYDNWMPWGKDGKTPSFSFCGCCGVEWGVKDFTLKSLKKYRKKWLNGNPNKWFCPEEKPKNWDISIQLKNIPEEFI